MPECFNQLEPILYSNLLNFFKFNKFGYTLLKFFANYNTFLLIVITFYY